MRHRELVEKVLELEEKLDRIEKLLPEPSCMEIIASTPNLYSEPLDTAYDPPLTQLDIDPDFQG